MHSSSMVSALNHHSAVFTITFAEYVLAVWRQSDVEVTRSLGEGSSQGKRWGVMAAREESKAKTSALIL